MKLLVRLLLVATIISGFLSFRLLRPYQGFTGETFVELPHGTSTSAMADLLAKAGVIGSSWDFLLARVVSPGHVLQAGEYRFDRAASALDVLRRIERGDIFYYPLVVPEGKNMFNIGAAVEQFGVFKAADFVAAASNPALIHDLDPQAPTLEGYLFPDKYKLGRHTTPEQLCKQMTGKFREAWRGIQTAQPVHEVITLASMVEKEGKLAEERPRIAAVFENRLRIGMKLDCDPTTVYAALLTGNYRGTIYRSDLDRNHPYNTYSHPGLPPGPIANPGRASIDAVLKPATIDAIYFVARPDGSGGHEFSNNVAAHEAAVERYRSGIRNHQVR
jgi:UPF0755 protein